jgi:hypothetical protein
MCKRSRKSVECLVYSAVLMTFDLLGHEAVEEEGKKKLLM